MYICIYIYIYVHIYIYICISKRRLSMDPPFARTDLRGSPCRCCCHRGILYAIVAIVSRLETRGIEPTRGSRATEVMSKYCYY